MMLYSAFIYRIMAVEDDPVFRINLEYIEWDEFYTRGIKLQRFRFDAEDLGSF